MPAADAPEAFQIPFLSEDKLVYIDDTEKEEGIPISTQLDRSQVKSSRRNEGKSSAKRTAKEKSAVPSTADADTGDLASSEGEELVECKLYIQSF